MVGIKRKKPIVKKPAGTRSPTEKEQTGTIHAGMSIAGTTPAETSTAGNKSASIGVSERKEGDIQEKDTEEKDNPFDLFPAGGIPLIASYQDEYTIVPLRVKPIKGDGDCFFHALAHVVPPPSYPSRPGYQPTLKERQREQRRDLSNYLLEHAEEEWVHDYVSIYPTRASQKEVTVTPAEYAEHMLHEGPNGHWGENAALNIFARRRRINAVLLTEMRTVHQETKMEEVKGEMAVYPVKEPDQANEFDQQAIINSDYPTLVMRFTSTIGGKREGDKWVTQYTEAHYEVVRSFSIQEANKPVDAHVYKTEALLSDEEKAKRCQASKADKASIGIELGAERSRASAIVEGRVKLIGDIRSTFYPTSPTEFDIGRSYHNVIPGDYITDACQIRPSALWSCQRRENMYHTRQGAFSQLKVISAILLHLRRMGLEKLECSEEKLTAAVIAIPTFSTNGYRQTVMGAAREAGFTTVHLINASTAAAMTFKDYNYDASIVYPKIRRHIGIIACGAKSFEASVFEMDIAGSFRLLSSAGTAEIGGHDFTNVMVQNALQEIVSQSQKGDEGGVVAKVELLKTIWEGCVPLKEALVSMPKAGTNIYYNDKEYVLRADRETLASQDNARHLLLYLNIAFNGYAEKIEEVLYIGGSSLLSFIREEVRRITLNAKSTTNVPLKDAVTGGAAIRAALEMCPRLCPQLMRCYIPDFIYTPIYLQLSNGTLPLIQRGSKLGERTYVATNEGGGILCGKIYSDHTTIAVFTTRLGLIVNSDYTTGMVLVREAMAQ